MTYDLFSKRQKRERGEVPEVLSFDILPTALRVQIKMIIDDAFGVRKSGSGESNRPQLAYSMIHKILCREYGVFEIGVNGSGYAQSELEQVKSHLLYSPNVDQVLDIIELSFRYISRVINKDLNEYEITVNISMTPEEAMNELNLRFREHGVGYQFESDKIIRVDSTYMHSEVTKPTLSLLWDERFTGANEEYLKAHEHYRHGRNKECLTDCLKAFESAIKTICNENGWTYNPTDTASKLISICFTNNLIPSFTQNQFSSLQNLLTTGIPTIRNKVGGHGQGQVPQKVDDELTRYGLNLTGANIIFLIEQSGLK
ncbi:STM4504/CBY_0614 family protein [Pedobacter jejuensis]|uniref:Abortive infection protein-like C-terminal domain-containing protein n=1 Tax=Pedobacter jejuensis TaxID=1268550 RepID=A0A3N0C3E9_9SPHI|nr:hypothetical protein [Pedobacter jejuensis]RNL56540.1 hypothetical protein D7004_01235 [Pedobacter jejuensis]